MDSDELYRKTMETNICDAIQELDYIMKVNEAQKNVRRKVCTCTYVFRNEDRFIAVNGSAHMMPGLFEELFRKRPELVDVVRSVMGRMYRVVDA